MLARWIKFTAAITAGLVIIVMLLTLQPTCVYACDCYIPDDPQEAAVASAAVFSGEVIAMKQEKKGGESYSAALMEVDTTWKGVEQSQAIVYTAISSCQFDFQIGQKYLLYAYEKQGDLHVINCGRSGSLPHVLADVNALGEGKLPSETVDLSGPFSVLRLLMPIIATVAVLLIGGAVLIVVVRRLNKR